jgi:hypothetical protein
MGLNETKGAPAGRYTRRTVLAGVAAATTAAAVGVPDRPAHAESVDASNDADMVAFVLLSSALTGIAENRLAPGFAPFPVTGPVDLTKQEPGSDPVDIKQDYFNWVNDRYPAAFENLLRIVKDNVSLGEPDRTKAILDKVQFPGDDESLQQREIDIKYLARSIVLMWYLGCWYEPLVLMKSEDAAVFQFKVISPTAYTQAWALRVAQAHPMGFSEMQFGYWTRDANPTKDFIGVDLKGA